MKVETGLLNPETDQYAGTGHVATDIAAIARESKRMEALGFDTLCTPEAGHDPFLPLMIAAEHTSSIGLATNVAIAFPRSPLVVAQMAWDLQQLSGGRFRLGLGTQVKGHNVLRYSTPWDAPPGPRLREYILCLGAIFKSFQNGGSPEVFEGEHYKFSLMPPFFNPGPIPHPELPLYVAAVNKYMCRLGGELCDGIRLHPIATFSYTREVVLPTIEAGARKAGRTLAEVDLVGAPFLAIGRDEEAVARARQTLKQHIAFYASTRTYHTVLEHHGWQEIGAELHRLSREGKWKELPALISDEMLDEWAISATYDELAAKIKERCTGLFSTVLFDLPRELREDDERVRSLIRDLR